MELPTIFFSSEDEPIYAAHYPTGLTTISEEPEDRPVYGSASIEQEDCTQNEGPSIKRRRLTVACIYCGHGFTEKKSLYRHQRTSSDCKAGNKLRESHPCGACPKVFSRADVLQRHEREHHLLSGRRESGKVGPGVSDLEHADDSSAALTQEAILYDESDEGLNKAKVMQKLHEDDEEKCSTYINHNNEDLERMIHPSIATDQAGPLSTITTISTPAAESPGLSDPVLALPLRSRSSLERLGASHGYMATKGLPPCPACRKPFETDRLKLLAHIQSHVQLWKSEFVCKECNIGFQCRENLDFHSMSANRGSCGLIGFEHKCTGHHPPNQPSNTPGLTSHEHLLMCSFLRHWEQAQLDALIIGVDDLTVGEEHTSMRRWSWSRYRAPPSTNRSSSILPPSFRSEPKHVTGKPWKAIRLIEQKLASLSSNGPSALIRKRAAENASIMRMNELRDSLYRAIEEGDVAGVEQLLYSGADPTICRPLQMHSFQISFLTHKNRYSGQRAAHIHSQKFTPLALATVLGRLEIATILANFGAIDTSPPIACLGDIDLTGLAMVFEPPGIAPQLLKRYADDSQLPSRIRSWRGELEKLGSSNARDFLEFLAAPESSRLYAWQLAEYLISVNYSLGLQAVLDVGVSPNMVTRNGFTSLLEYALSQNSVESALVLMLYGASCDTDTTPPLISAVFGIVSQLLAQSFRKEAKHILDRLYNNFGEADRASVLSLLLAQAIENVDFKVITLLAEDYEIRKWTWPSALQSGTYQQLQSNALREHEVHGPPLSFAAYKGHVGIVKMFLASGANALETGGIYGSALCNAVIAGDVQIVRILLNAGADPNQSCRGGEPALHRAARHSRVDIAAALVQRGADLHEDVPSYGTAFMIAVRRDDLAMCKYLLKAGNNINFGSTRYGTALCAALSRSPESCDYLPMVEFLLENGADPIIGGSLGNAVEVAFSMRKRYRGVQATEIDMAVNLLRKATKDHS